MGKTSYEMIEAQAGGGAVPAKSETAGGGGGEASSLIPGSKPTRQRWMVAVAGVVMAGAFVGAFASSGRFSAATGTDAQGSTSAASSAATPMQASKNDGDIPSCSLASCTSSGCDWDSAPFLCLGGGSNGGCADKASTWSPETGSCTSFCDLSDCSDTLERAGSGAEGAEDLPRHCGPCDDKQCSKIAAQPSQACGTAAPFVCLSGAATWGCADKELAWASAPATTCGECCRVGQC